MGNSFFSGERMFSVSSDHVGADHRKEVKKMPTKEQLTQFVENLVEEGCELLGVDSPFNGEEEEEEE